MSNEIPVFTCAVRCDAVRGRIPSHDEALSLITEDNYNSTSRNWWYQGLVAKLLGVYDGFEELGYITEVVAVIETEQLATTIAAINGLMEAVKVNTEPFVRVTSWYGASAKQVREFITQAKVSRALNDDCIYAFQNFFSFLVSQAAALEEAKEKGSCIVYVQPQP